MLPEDTYGFRPASTSFPASRKIAKSYGSPTPPSELNAFAQTLSS